VQRGVVSARTQHAIVRPTAANPLLSSGWSSLGRGRSTETQESAFTRWTAKEAEWKAAAKEKGREVEITFVGAHELLTALTEPRTRGGPGTGSLLMS
jgi:hypothetical protein